MKELLELYGHDDPRFRSCSAFRTALAFLVRGALALGCLARSPVRLRLVGRRSRPSESPPCSNTILASRRSARLPSNSRGVWSSARTIADEMEIVMADVDEVGPALVWDWSHAFAGGRGLCRSLSRARTHRPDPTRPDPGLALAVGVLARMSQPPAAARHHDEPDRVTEATKMNDNPRVPERGLVRTAAALPRPHHSCRVEARRDRTCRTRPSIPRSFRRTSDRSQWPRTVTVRLLAGIPKSSP